ncbi:alpha-xylosidase [Sphingobacterium mizutaii NBRC 14946 = DSM 11724]|uniref:Alpha-xylosidase n=2 Tax=Sphingobacterium mizutaii TaxID=1010 RepID=A0AAJ4XCQ1_9SPHI|nr:TIM-barrel domain-containing protein [Sphingobacterium mizutaii]GEM67636.1 alpha-xylosidase [Sphingobacterium mizutaii NBRC 14946 = DSM 11724]SDL15830.1 Alpha-glucosidase, glycosyl hydrolase family GH31 [Sphingobacterium mizutaii]SNV52578.1 Alpha-xylosidase [Sphingobacterium mizutaii]
MYRNKQKLFWALGLSLLFSTASPASTFVAAETLKQQTQEDSVRVESVQKINPTTVQVKFSNNQLLLVDFYADNIFRLFQDNKSAVVRDPQAEPAAQILVNNPRKKLHNFEVSEKDGSWFISTKDAAMEINKENGLFKIYNIKNKQLVTQSIAPISFNKKKVSLQLTEDPTEYFYGGGVQNGRFSHKGKSIAIENTNNWTDGGVASPTPFYWSTKGYGMMWYTFKKGKYDFGNTEKGKVKLSHDSDYLDLFFMVSDNPVGVLNDFYQLTGNPVLMPKFGFYEGHLNAYNRDFWKEDEKGILFEDGKRYKESQKNEGGTKESLNGEKNNYQFSARAVIDRYQQHDMPLGWILPNDGYGAGYGQEKTLDGNIQNLKSLGDYARSKGVEIGLWTQSDLHPKDSIDALLQRDIVKEVRDAGVRVLKTDVAWVGAGYSFGLNGVADVGHIMPYYGNNARPFIISLDGWAGTQRYAGIWSGDQTGGQWEYIRFHIPTYIGSGLSGQPNITSDMDGIFGGKNTKVNTRDFQWKTFTPMELNMDGWGSNEKYPQALGEPFTSINRNYLKLKSELLPYAYSIAKEAVDGKPMIRAMMLDYPNPYTLGSATQYQFLYGPFVLVAPIYQETKVDTVGNDIRNGIYLPEGNWIDYFSGDLYAGNTIVNNFDAPIWKTPVFIKAGAIIPRVNPNNNVQEINKKHRIYEIYPEGKTHFYEYDDDGKTQAYLNKEGVYTCIESDAEKKGEVNIVVHNAEGDFPGFEKQKSTEFWVNMTKRPKKISVKVGKKNIKLREVQSKAEFESSNNVYYYEEKPNLNAFSTKGSAFEQTQIIKNPQLLVKVEETDVSLNPISLTIKGFEYTPADRFKKSSGALNAPSSVSIPEEKTKAYTLEPTWDEVDHADYYEIEFDGQKYSYIQDNHLLFEGLKPETQYTFKIRSVNKDGASDWKDFSQTTKSNPLQFAITGLTAETSVPNQGSEGVDNLVDFDEGNMWHTKWGQKAVPFELIVDLNSFNQLDKFQYLPRSGRGNGILLEGKVEFSNDKEQWTEAGDFKWENNDSMKEFSFKEQPKARFVKLKVSKAVGDFGSGRELYVFKVPGTDSYRPGDINNDRLIDINDLTSYTNYTGLRMGDADFEGYVSNGDINKNGLIDAYDISAVATKLEGGVEVDPKEDLSGSLKISASKANYSKDDIVEVYVKADNLKDVNAFSFALPYSPQDFEFVGIDNHLAKQMYNMTNDRLHSNGQKALYPTFVNLGDKDVINSKDGLVITIKFKAKRAGKFNLTAKDMMLVSKGMKSLQIK